MQGLTERQREVLTFITSSTATRGFPPTLREIGEELHIASTNGVNDHLHALIDKGYLTRTEQRSRSLVPSPLAHQELQSKLPRAPPPPNLVTAPFLPRAPSRGGGSKPVPIEQPIDLDQNLLPPGVRSVFALLLRGDSMVGDALLEGDLIFVAAEQTPVAGDRVVVLLENEPSCRRYFPEGDVIRFQPSHPKMVPIFVKAADFRPELILGVVVGVFRQIPS